MIVLLLGSGVQGKAAAYDLVHNASISKVVIADRTENILANVAKWLDSEKCKVKLVDAAIKDKVVELIREEAIDIIICSVPWKVTIPPLEAAIEAGVNFVDFGLYQNLEFDKRLTEFDERAKKVGITIIPSCGLAPGMTNMLAAYGASKLDQIDTVQVFVGGIPEKPQPPLGYKTVWNLEGVWTQYMEACRVIKNGKPDTVEAMTGIEYLEFTDLGTFEAAYTDGLGTLLHAYQKPILKGVKNIYEKTVRWPGHYEKIKTLKECGLLNTEPIDVSECFVSPREFLSKLLAPKLKLEDDEKDMTLLRVNVIGEKGGRKANCCFEMVDYKDESTGILSMARTTGFTGAIVVNLLAEKRIENKGVVVPEELGANKDIFHDILNEYAKRNIIIKEI